MRTFKNKIKTKIAGKSEYGNDEWKKANNAWYEDMHDGNNLLHEDCNSLFYHPGKSAQLRLGKKIIANLDL